MNICALINEQFEEVCLDSRQREDLILWPVAYTIVYERGGATCAFSLGSWVTYVAVAVTISKKWPGGDMVAG